MDLFCPLVVWVELWVYPMEPSGRCDVWLTFIPKMFAHPLVVGLHIVTVWLFGVACSGMDGKRSFELNEVHPFIGVERFQFVAFVIEHCLDIAGELLFEDA